MLYVFTQDDLTALTPESRLENIRGELAHILELNYSRYHAADSATLAELVSSAANGMERLASSVHCRFPFYPASSVAAQQTLGDLVYDLMRKVGA